MSILLAEMLVRLGAARNQFWQTAWAVDHPQAVADHSVLDLPLVELTGVFVAEASYEVTQRAAEVFGVMGILRDMPWFRYVHDTQVFLHAGRGDTVAKLGIAERIDGYRRPAVAVAARKETGMRTSSLAIAGAVCAAALALTVGPAQAAEKYPNKPIRIIVPSAASSGPDVVSRLIGGRLTEAWGEQVVIDARPGAAGNIASEIAARAAPDGYTLLMGSSQQISGPLFFDKLGYDLIRDFVPISLIASTPYALSVHPSVAATSVKELIALAKVRPGTLHYGSSGMGGAPHIAAEMLKTLVGINLVHVPYKSVVFALIDVMAGQVQMAISVLPAALPMIRQGKLRALGVTSLKRTALAPELEPIADSVPGYEILGWYGLVAPVKTSPKIVAALNAEIDRAMKSLEVLERVQTLGVDPHGSTPREFADFMLAEHKKIGKLIESAGLRNK